MLKKVTGKFDTGVYIPTHGVSQRELGSITHPVTSGIFKTSNIYLSNQISHPKLQYIIVTISDNVLYSTLLELE